jgi:hypothetical protein
MDSNSESPLMDSLSKKNYIGTYSRFFSFTYSLFFPESKSGPKLTLPVLMNTLGSLTFPQI